MKLLLFVSTAVPSQRKQSPWRNHAHHRTVSNASARDPYPLLLAGHDQLARRHEQRADTSNTNEAIVTHMPKLIGSARASPDASACGNYKLELAASALDTRRRQGGRIALAATRDELGEVGEGGWGVAGEWSLPIHAAGAQGRLAAGVAPVSSAAAAVLVVFGICETTQRQRRNPSGTSTEPRAPNATRAWGERGRGAAAASFVSPPSRGSWRGALSRRAEVAPSIPCEPPPRPPPPPAAARRAAPRPSETSGAAGDGSGRFCAGISRQGPRAHGLPPVAAAAFPR